MKRRLPIAAVAAVIAVALAGCGGGGTKSGTSARDDYVQANNALFKSLPHYPSATVHSGGTSAYSGKNNSVGYQTRFDVTVPATATATKLQIFYGGHLQPAWTLVAQLDGPVMNFRKGDAFVSINMTNSAHHRVEVTVDQAFYKHVG